jgi:hypothetical protein
MLTVRRKLLLVVSVMLYSSSILLSQDKTPKYSNEFLNLGIGARAMGMANAQVAIADEVTSNYWNPAGLTDIRRKYEIALMHASYFAGIANYDYIGFATPIDSLSHIAASIIRFAVDDIPDTRYLYDANGAINYNNIRFFTAADYAFMVSYARKIPKLKNLSIGGNVKIVHRKVGEFANAWGFGLDFGAKITLKKWYLGAIFRDVFGTFNAWSHNADLVADVYAQTGNIIPENSLEITLPKLIIGFGHQFLIRKKVGILPSIDLEFTFDGKRNVPVSSDITSLTPHLGIEFDYKKIGFLRLGIDNFQKIKDFDGSTFWSYQPAFGLGVRIKIMTVDYAFIDIGDFSESLYSHVFSLKVSFD